LLTKHGQLRKTDLSVFLFQLNKEKEMQNNTGPKPPVTKPKSASEIEVFRYLKELGRAAGNPVDGRADWGTFEQRGRTNKKQ
jgi:hypothetical protein